MKDKDFRPGDPVTYVDKENNLIRTYVAKIKDYQKHPVNITDYVETFLKCGRSWEHDKYPSLFHGHNVSIEVKIIGEELPKRTVKRWVNIRIMKDGSYLVSRHYLSKEAALSAAKHHEESYNHHFVAKAVEIEVPETQIIGE